MKTLKRLLALLMAAALSLTLFACKDTTGEESGAPDSSEPVSAAPDPSEPVSAAPDPSEPVSAAPDPSAEIVVDLNQTMYRFSSGLDDNGTAVTVNGKPITNEMFFYWLSYYCYNTSYYAYFYGVNADFSDEETRVRMIESTRDAVVYHMVLRELCEEGGVTVTDEQRAELQGQIDDMGLDALLKARGVAQDEITAQLEEGLEATLQKYELTREQVHQAGLESILQNLGVSEESFQYIAQTNYLFSNYAEYVMGEPTAEKLEQYVEDQGIFAVKHILLKTVDDSMNPLEDSVVAEKKALADDLLAQLRKADDLEEKFDELMMANSEDSPQSNPNGYVFDSASSLVGGFREATLELEPGEISGVVETDYGYHILLRLPVDASQYEEDWYTDGADEAVMKAVETADITVADEITALDVNNFYNRYMAYNTELYNSLYPSADDGSGDGPTPEE